MCIPIWFPVQKKKKKLIHVPVIRLDLGIEQVKYNNLEQNRRKAHDLVSFSLPRRFLIFFITT